MREAAETLVPAEEGPGMGARSLLATGTPEAGCPSRTDWPASSGEGGASSDGAARNVKRRWLGEGVPREAGIPVPLLQP
jgi:hypothetical protein